MGAVSSVGLGLASKMDSSGRHGCRPPARRDGASWPPPVVPRAPLLPAGCRPAMLRILERLADRVSDVGARAISRLRAERVKAPSPPVRASERTDLATSGSSE